MLEERVAVVRVEVRGGVDGGCCSRVSWQRHFVQRLCEKVSACEGYPQARAAGRLEGELFLFKHEVAG